MITVCHHSPSLVMPNGDPRDGYFYLTLMIDFYIAWSFSSTGDDPANISSSGTEDEESTEEELEEQGLSACQAMRGFRWGVGAGITML